MSATQHTTPEQEHELSETRRRDTPRSLELLEALRMEKDQLRTALVTRIVIEQAKGMVAERLEMEVDEAFERLRREARNRRMKLHALAAAVVAREAWTNPIFRAREPANPAHAPAVHTGVGASAPTTTASARTRVDLRPKATLVDRAR
jgi:hypothetical protein